MTHSYTDANGVYLNKLGLTDAEQLRNAEYAITANKSREILERNVFGKPGSFGLEYQQAIHKHLFEGVYDWAGKTRTISFYKRIEYGDVSVFAEPKDFDKYWRDLEKKTNTFTKAEGLTFEQKRETLAEIFIEANHIHPFPEGNGRSLQVFMKQLAREQGVELDFSKIDSNRWNWASAVSGLHGRLREENGYIHLDAATPNRDPIKTIFQEITKPRNEYYQALNQNDTNHDTPGLKTGLTTGNIPTSTLSAYSRGKQTTNPVPTAKPQHIENKSTKGRSR